MRKILMFVTMLLGSAATAGQDLQVLAKVDNVSAKVASVEFLTCEVGFNVFDPQCVSELRINLRNGEAVSTTIASGATALLVRGYRELFMGSTQIKSFTRSSTCRMLEPQFKTMLSVVQTTYAADHSVEVQELTTVLSYASCALRRQIRPIDAVLANAASNLQTLLLVLAEGVTNLH